jgi:hypothetical protein
LSFRLVWLYPAFKTCGQFLKQISCPSTRVRTDLFSLVHIFPEYALGYPKSVTIFFFMGFGLNNPSA